MKPTTAEHSGRIVEKYIVVMAIVVAAASSQAARAQEFAHSPAYITRVNAEAFKGAAPEEIARYLAHFSGGVASGAVQALAAGGEKNLPLIEKLLKDTNPYIRGGAVRVLAAMYRPDGDDKNAEPPKETAALKEVMDLVAAMQDDPHREVQAAVGDFFKAVRVENALVHSILIAQATDPDPSVRSKTVEAVRRWIKDPATRLRVGMEVLRRPQDVSPHALSLSSSYLLEQKDRARGAIPIVVAYLNDRAHTVRGFFSNGPYQRGLKLIEYHFDAKLETTPGLVQAICRSVVRIPYSTYNGWMDALHTTIRLMEGLSPSSAPAVRAAAAAEAAWLTASTDDEIKAVTPASGLNVGTAREEAVKRVAYLRAMAAWLAAGKPVTAKPAFQFPQDKKKAPKKKPPAKKPKK